MNQAYLDCARCGEERRMCLILLCICFVCKTGRFYLSGDVIIFLNFFWKKKKATFSPLKLRSFGELTKMNFIMF